MRVERHYDVTAFYEHAGPFLLEREAQHSVQLGFRTSLERDLHAYGPADPLLLTVAANGRVVGVAIQTPPHALLLSEMPREAVEALVEELRGHDLPGVGARVEVGAAFVELWPAPARVEFEQRIYSCDAVRSPREVPGAMRPYRDADRRLAGAWVDAFTAEAMPGSDEGSGEAFVQRRLAAGAAVRFREDGGEPVSFLVYGSPTANGMRVGPVYTPPELRGRGYASALTAAATQEILDGGKRFACLITDLANPTSNSIYQQVGYSPVVDVNLWRFERA
ncbi:MAG TPA: GNAT family N-acetyltransferase [Gaiellaceae bacterium]|jgi:predicted GNAT family acetyltransferase|nr:GNAT family N-acetyltransferase [Gaiellaceae bacterium]